MLELVFITVCILVFIIIKLWNKVSNQEAQIWSIKREMIDITFYLNNSVVQQPTENDQTNSSNVAVPEPTIIINEEQTVQAKAEKEPKYPSFIPAEQTKTDYFSSKPVSTVKAESMESWFGRNVLGIAASILVFVSFIFLGKLVYNEITDTMKIFAMYIISALVTGLGIALMVKKRNNFTEILVGCGSGCFFISILLTHIYFNRINDIAAFSLLLVWMVLILFLSKILSSTLLSIVAHIGMIVSICFAFSSGLTDEKLALILIYQGVSIAVILFGNILCCKKTYNFGVFVSLFLTIIASSFMWYRFTANVSQSTPFPFATSLPTIGIALAFIAQFLCASFLSYLLSISTNRLKDEALRITVHFVNKAFWLAALVMNVYHITYRISLSVSTNSVTSFTANQQFKAVFVAVMITNAVLLAHAAVTLIMSLKFNFNKKLETFSVLFLSLVASIFLIILWDFQFGIFNVIPRISGLIIISLLLLLANRISKNNIYAVGANVILALDFLYMLFDGYRNLSRFGTIALSMVYILIYLAIIWTQWYFKSADEKAKHSTSLRLYSYLLVEASLISIFVTSHLKYSTPILLLILTALNIILYLVRYDRSVGEYSAVITTMFINEIILLAFDATFIAFAYKNVTLTILYLLLSALAFGLAFCRINKVFDGSDVYSGGIVTGIKLTVLVLASVFGHTSWFEQAYSFSIWCMLIALTCIILGFKGRVKSLRLYGLVLTLVCVLKLVTYDVADLNTILRVFALIFGGIICFIISAIYNYTTKKIENKNE